MGSLKLQVSIKWLASILCLTAVLLPCNLMGQVNTGAVLGTVKDPSGAVIPGATITLADQGTGLNLSTVTGSNGSFMFTPVKIGTYTVTAGYKGFQTVRHPNVVVNVQQQVVVNVTLQPGAVTQTVEVTSSVPLLQTQNASVGQVVSGPQINNLPLNGRNYTFLAQLAAGVNQMQQDSRGLGQSGGFTANGTRPAQNNYLLDGIDNNSNSQDFLNGFSYVVRPPVDAINEFKVETANYSAENGRGGGAVLNATLKSGTNQFHGDAWEFLRNDKLDAADFFENAGGIKKGEFRQNQFGFTLGGPIKKNKTFFFGDFEGTRIRQGTVYFATVPTLAERASGFTNFSDLISGQPGQTPADLLGRTFALGTAFDPATTRPVTQGQVDPVTGLAATGSGFVRDPFVGNIIPANRIDPNAVKLLDLFPLPTNTNLFSNYTDNPVQLNDSDNFDVRVDQNFSERDQMFVRVSYNHNPRFIPGPFSGLADGGNFNAEDQTVETRNAALSETHSFSSSTINVFQYSFGRVHTFFLQTSGNQMGIPAQYGIQGVPQVTDNGGLPQISISGLQPFGAPTFQPDDEWDDTSELADDLTKIYGSHTFKSGFEFMHLRFATLQPAFPRGNFGFGGSYTSIPGINVNNAGRVQFVLTPTAATVPGGISFNGGPDSLNLSNIATTDDLRNYYAGYLQDDWKAKPALTLNLGLRYEYFGPIQEKYGAQSNFVPGAPFSGAEYLIPQSRQTASIPNDQLSPSFISTLQKDGIALKYLDNPSLVTAQRTNFGPRFGFAFQATPKFVVRGGYGLFYGGFENVGFGPNLGANYPFQFTFSFSAPSPTTPIVFPNGSNATLETSFANIPLTGSHVNAEGLSVLGINTNLKTAYTQSTNLTLQYQFTPNTSAQIAYVGTFSRHLTVFSGANEVSELLIPSVNFIDYIPFPDLAPSASYQTSNGNGYYNGLQFNFERRFSHGLNFLANYSYSKCRTDAADTLNATAIGYRAPYVPGFGIQGDYGFCDTDIRNVVHFSGGYQIPMGQGQRFLRTSTGALNQLAGGWSMNWIVTLQDGQPFTIPCDISTAAAVGCDALLVPGQNPIGGQHDVNQWMNPAAFTNPPVVASNGQTNLAPLGGTPSQVVGPGFHRLDFSLFKEFRTSENTHIEFRTEFFNLFNIPNFSTPQGPTGGTALVSAPGALDFRNPNFGRITSTRDTPNDPREIQFALKFYW